MYTSPFHQKHLGLDLGICEDLGEELEVDFDVTTLRSPRRKLHQSPSNIGFPKVKKRLWLKFGAAVIILVRYYCTYVHGVLDKSSRNHPRWLEELHARMYSNIGRDQTSATSFFWLSENLYLITCGGLWCNLRLRLLRVSPLPIPPPSPHRSPSQVPSVSGERVRCT